MSNMSEIQHTVPAGWYDDGSGRQRWWDGNAWGPIAPAATPAAAQQKFSGISIAGFVLACVGLLAFAGGVLGIILTGLAFIFSLAGMADKTRRGRGFAAAGLIVAAAGMTLSILHLIA